MSRARLVLIPVVLFAAFAGGVLTLAKLHLAKPAAPAATSVVLGNPQAGHAVFAQKCAACHGPNGAGGGIGPKLAGVAVPLAVAKAQIDNGGGVMPAGLVAGTQESDVLAYLKSIFSAAP